MRQAKAPQTMLFDADAFGATGQTVIRWLGLSGFLINSRGTIMMVDPFLKGAKVDVLKGLEFPVMIDYPIAPEKVPHLDAVLITHGDTDHFDLDTCLALSPVTGRYHSTHYVNDLMKQHKLTSSGHGIGDVFSVGDINIKLTPADHAWQNTMPGVSEHFFKHEDAGGFWIDTPDGTIWAQGDSRLMEDHLHLPFPDVIFFDISDSEWHFGYEGAARIANAYPKAKLLLCHWGSVDAPGFPPFNADPKDIYGLIDNPERIHLLAPGESFLLK